MKTWLPIITLVLGWAGGLATEALRDRRARQRERDASDRERQALRAEQQRGTLLDLQDALWEVQHWTPAVRGAMSWAKAAPETEKQEAWERVSQVKNQLSDARAKVMLLVTRVEDKAARNLVMLYFAAAYLAVPTEDDPAETDLRQVIEQVVQHYRHAMDRLGELIRE